MGAVCATFCDASGHSHREPLVQVATTGAAILAAISISAAPALADSQIGYAQKPLKPSGDLVLLSCCLRCNPLVTRLCYVSP